MIESAVILAGGLGTRLAEETHSIPKPMVRIGNMPILWHIMKIYYHYEVKNFVICGGYKKEEISFFFRDYDFYVNDFKFNSHGMTKINSKNEDWTVTILDTGYESQTAYRLHLASDYLNDSSFHFTYGDGLSDCDVSAIDMFSSKVDSSVVLSAVAPPGRFGVLVCQGEYVTRFQEKALGSDGLINGGFGVIKKGALASVNSNTQSFEEDVLPVLAKKGQLKARQHLGFWHPMDTLRDKRYLESLWAKGRAPWKVWS